MKSINAKNCKGESYPLLSLVRHMSHQNFIPYLFLTTPEGSTLILLSLFLFLCSYFLLLPLFPHGSTLLLTNSPPSLTETIYLSLRWNQTLTKVSASIVGKYICLFSIMDILMVVWFALVSLLCSLV